jgi:outer membrane protein OmpA-like peptidoglycan-associated protein
VPIVWAQDDSNSGAVVGLQVGAGIPISDFQSVADPGGVIAPWFGYKLAADNIAIIPMVQTQFAFFPANDQDVTFDPPKPVGANRVQTRTIIKSDSQNLFAVSGGFRISLFDETREFYFGGMGGYYTDMGGPLRGAGPGFGIEAGLNYEIMKDLALGIYIRRDEAFMRGELVAEPNNDDNLTYLTSGIALTYLFAAPAAAAPPPPPPPPPPAPEPAPVVKKKIVLRGVNFAFDSDKIDDEAKPILDEAVRVLGEAGVVNVSVEGHTDSTGPEDYNQGLSERRANSVRTYLETKGVAGDRLQAVGFGESKPVASNDTRDGRAQNRRVELRVLE